MNNDEEVQVIFNKVISAGLYDPSSKHDISRKRYMCNALKVASNKAIITLDEHILAKNAIRGYLKSTMETLFTFLTHHNYPSEDTDCLAVYKNWANRPQPRVLL